MHPEDKQKHFNWLYRLTHYYWIQTKIPGVVAQLILNPIQKILCKYLPFWKFFLILKARQEGVSTLFLLWHLDATIFTPNTKTCILADERDNLAGLFQIIKFAYESMPASIQLADGRIWHKPKARYDNRNELYFEGINSTIYVALKIRSKTVHRLHVSEWAFIKNAGKVLTATFAAVPKDGVISGETTANGMGGSFYEEWTNEFSRFMKFFFGYQDHPDYCDPIDDEKKFRETLTEEEKKLLAMDPHPVGYIGSGNGIKLGNIAWRRRMLSIAANRKEFAQEFPCTAEEAFLSSGRSPFDRDKIKDWIIREPILSKMEGRLLYWKKAQEGHRYIASVDTASGRGIENLDQADAKEGGTDYDVVQIWDCDTLELCAMFRGKWPYAKLHEVIHPLAVEFNHAYVIIEATDHGLTVINNFVRDYIDRGLYPRELMHTTEYLDKKTKQKERKWGFYTNLKTRPLILDHLAQLIGDELIRCYSSKAQSECLQFIIDDNGDMHAMDGYHDDIVLCAAIGLYNISAALRVVRTALSKKDIGFR